MGNGQFGIRLSGIHTVAKGLSPMPQQLLAASAIFNFNITVETRVVPENKLVMPLVKVTVTEVGKEEQTLFTIALACLFEIDDFENLIKPNENNELTVPPELENLLRPIAISTTRGVIYSELRGTYLNNAIMPIVFMDAFAQQQSKPEDDVKKAIAKAE